MNRRRLMLAAFALALLPVSVARADDDDLDELVDILKDQGYERVTLEQTLLGRTRILAHKDGGTREIIINARTGEVLRDVWIDAGGRSQPSEFADHSGKGRGGRDDDDGDDHGGGSDDKSGKGSSHDD